VTTPDAPGAPRGLGLAPIGVLPAHQRRGIGAHSMTAALERARTSGFAFVVLLGHPAYDPRFGFVRAGLHALRCVDPSPPEAFMVLDLAPGAMRGVHGLVHYHPAFAAL
jgi:putative acetyltransferase